MAIDPRIILGIQPAQFKVADPLESAQKSLALQHLMGQQDLQGLQLDEARRGAESNQRLQALFSSNPNASPEDVIRIDPQRGLKMRQDILTNRKTEGDINRARAETLGKLLTFQKEGAGAVLANPTPENAIAAVDQFERLATSFGMPELSQLAAQQRAAIQQTQGNPEALKRIAAGWALTADKFLPNIQTRNTGGTTDTLAIDPLTGKATVTGSVRNTQSPDSAASVAATLRGQNMADARARETLAQGRWANDLDKGIQVNMQTGETRSITQGGAPIGPKEKPLTESQGKASGLALRAAEADKILRTYEKGISETGLAAKQAAEGVWGVGGVLGSIGNKMLSENQQKVEQAQRDFVNAALRVESGASISQSEFDNARKQYFPQPGDSAAVVEQKRKARQTEIEALKIQAGSGGKNVPDSTVGLRLPAKTVTVDY